MKIIVALLFLATLTFAKHECIHGTHDVEMLSSHDGNSKFLEDGRTLAPVTYEPLRILVDYTYLTEGKAVIREYIKNQLVASAVSYYQEALQVVRASSLKIPDTCGVGGIATPTHLRGFLATDIVILITAVKSTDSYLAYAKPCAKADNTNDRPTYGQIVFNLNHLPTSDDVDLEENLITTLHEMAHILGFSNYLYGFFQDRTTGLKLTNPVKQKTVNGKNVYYLDIPYLKDKLLAHFGCDTGAYLENEGGSGSSGSHFERRIFHNEFMTASSITDSVFSEFTLAVLEGTGWYQVKYNLAEPFTWGKGRGCTFFDDKCVKNNLDPAFPEFCPRLEQEGCSYTARAVAVCGTLNAKQTDSSLDTSYNYWSNKTVMLDSFGDNCPYFIGYPNVDCENPNDKDYATLNEEVFSTKSRCFPGNIGKFAPQGKQTGYCFPTTCTPAAGSTFTLSFTIGGKTISCASAGPQNIAGYYGTITCPDPTEFCKKANPAYCERGCSGRGTCTNGVCDCPTGWGGSDCAFRKYVDSCSRCAGESELKSCFGDGCACNPASGICTGDELIGMGDGGANSGKDGGDSDDASRLGVMSGLVVFMMLAMLLL